MTCLFCQTEADQITYYIYIVKFGLKIAPLPSAFAFAVNRASTKFADDLYKDVFPA